MFVVARNYSACFIRNDAFEGIYLSNQGDGVMQVDVYMRGGNIASFYINCAEAETLVVYLCNQGLIGKDDLEKLLKVIQSSMDY